MKTATVADLRNNFHKVSSWIDHGESVTITKRGRPFASLQPLGSKSEHPKAWPDRRQWRANIYKNATGAGNLLEVLDFDRGNT